MNGNMHGQDNDMSAPMFFDQTTKHVGSMNRYNQYSREDDYMQ